MTALGPTRTIPDRRPKARASRPGILLDRDGTLIVDHGYVGSIDRVDFIDGAAAAIALFNRAALPVVIVTNQSGVARGLYGLGEVEAVHAHIAGHLRRYGAHVDMFLYCPYHPSGVVEAFARTSDDRKPRPGMAHAAATALDLDLTASWVIGDRPEDMGLAKEIGACAINLGPEPCDRPRVWSFASLAEAAPFILDRVRT
jgi:D-sedoheptulose 7-phosphate isomerase/D-glycero-D-manno-heptose 1,7-bisphosphate phosphatase